MNFQERSYNGKFSRPRPEILFEEHASLLIIITPWGSRNGAKRAQRAISEFFLAARDDVEVTSPFQKLTCLSPTANILRVSAMLANDVVYQEDNRSEYQSGLEIFIGAQTGHEFSYVQLGHPQVFLDRPNSQLLPTGCLTDLSLDFSPTQKSLASLPNSLLGVYSTIAPTVRTLRVTDADRLVLVSHNWLPTAFYSLARDQRSLDTISGTLAEADAQEPFWLGQLTFG
ncbi:MAG: hypothetical protein IT288_17340 [Bdellovibrionales bacterium]|nr:hypothetical protein [Bdellovibrionales bacterium]